MWLRKYLSWFCVIPVGQTVNIVPEMIFRKHAKFTINLNRAKLQIETLVFLCRWKYRYCHCADSVGQAHYVLDGKFFFYYTLFTVNFKQSWANS